MFPTAAAIIGNRSVDSIAVSARPPGNRMVKELQLGPHRSVQLLCPELRGSILQIRFKDQ